jgi:hypothetical protein
MKPVQRGACLLQFVRSLCDHSFIKTTRFLLTNSPKSIQFAPGEELMIMIAILASLTYREDPKIQPNIHLATKLCLKPNRAYMIPVTILLG